MKITTIDGKEYSRELEEQIEAEGREELREKSLIATLSPYEFGALSGRIEVLFEDSKDRVVLPLQTNITKIWNITRYGQKPIWNWLRNLRDGRLQSVTSESIESFAKHLRELEIDSMYIDKLHRKHIDANWSDRFSKGTDLLIGKERIGAVGDTLDEQVDNIIKIFSETPKRFVIDSKSLLYMETRVRKDGSMYYKGALNIAMYIGASGAPGVTDFFYQSITAKTSPEI